MNKYFLRFKIIIFVFGFVVSKTAFASLWEVSMSADEKAANAEIILESVADLSDTISEENELEKHLLEVQKKSQSARSVLSEIGYTKDEIEELFAQDFSSLNDVAGAISRLSNRVKKSKALYSKFKQVAAVASPSAVVASQTMQMNETLKEISTELKHQRLDRESTKQASKIEEIKQKQEALNKEAFFQKQFALMQKSSKGKVTFFPYSFSKKDIQLRSQNNSNNNFSKIANWN